MVKRKIEPIAVLFCVVLFLVGLYLITSCSFKCSSQQKDGYMRFSAPGYKSSCEFQPACLWDTARWVRMNNGMSGVCLLHGIACPSFSMDHDRVRTMGLSPTMVSDNYMARLRARMEEREDRTEGDRGAKGEEFGFYEDIEGPDDYEMSQAGMTALDLGMYPTD